LISFYAVGEEDEVPMADTIAEDGEEPRGYPIVPFVARTQVILQKIANTKKWLESLRRKMKPREAMKHQVTYSTMLAAKW
jgi:hypothetical protein